MKAGEPERRAVAPAFPSGSEMNMWLVAPSSHRAAPLGRPPIVKMAPVSSSLAEPSTIVLSLICSPSSDAVDKAEDAIRSLIAAPSKVGYKQA